MQVGDGALEVPPRLVRRTPRRVWYAPPELDEDPFERPLQDPSRADRPAFLLDRKPTELRDQRPDLSGFEHHLRLADGRKQQLLHILMELVGAERHVQQLEAVRAGRYLMEVSWGEEGNGSRDDWHVHAVRDVRSGARNRDKHLIELMPMDLTRPLKALVIRPYAGSVPQISAAAESHEAPDRDIDPIISYVIMRSHTRPADAGGLAPARPCAPDSSPG